MMPGSKTASGHIMRNHDMTVAHRNLPFGTVLLITNQSNGKEVIVTVNDRGPYHGNRILDLSKPAAKELQFINSGTANVCYTLIN